MIRFLELLIALLIVAVLFVIVGLSLPSHRSFSHTIETNRPLPVVFDSLDGLKRFKDWNTLLLRDPRMTTTLSGPAFGEGAKLDYSSTDKAIGDGSWTLVRSVPGERIEYRLDNGDYGVNKKMVFTFGKAGRRGRNIEVKQRYSVDYGWNLFGRYAGLYVSRSVGDHMKTGLDTFNNFLATVPKFDYSKLPEPIEVVEIAPRHVLFAPTVSKRSNDQIMVDMQTQMKWIRQVMDKNALEAAGPMRVVTTEYGAETYSYDVVQPVRKKGTGPAALAAAADESAAADRVAASEGDGEAVEGEAGEDGDALEAPLETAVTATAMPLEPLDVTLEGPVQLRQSYVGRAISTRYDGHPAGLAAVRDHLRAWGMTHGETTQERPFEEYLQDIDDSFGGEARFNAYWPIK